MISKVAINFKISDSTTKAYMDGQKITSLPTLISIADFLNCNLNYLLDRTDNPIQNNDLDNKSNNSVINQLIQIIISLPKNKQKLVIAFIEGFQG